jgi:hypothetical protein
MHGAGMSKRFSRGHGLLGAWYTGPSKCPEPSILGTLAWHGMRFAAGVKMPSAEVPDVYTSKKPRYTACWEPADEHSFPGKYADKACTSAQ